MKHTVALKQNHEFRRLYSKGRSAVSPYFVLYCRPNRRSYSRLGITTGVKLGNAVKRNRARRRIRELYRGEEQALLPGYDIVGLIRFYQKAISPMRPPCCRFIPTCSAYAVEAVEKYGAWKGGWLALRRVLRCNPFHRQKSIQYDPVP